jgi:Spx/MgsR family transcriptional regulator
MVHIYGIPNCNSVKKGLDALKAAGVAYTFHDFKKEGLSPERLIAWSQAVGTDALLNKKGTTWRGLSAAEQAGAATIAGARALMVEKTSLIKRPVVEWPDGTITVGLEAQGFEAQLQ